MNKLKDNKLYIITVLMFFIMLLSSPLDNMIFKLIAPESLSYTDFIDYVNKNEVCRIDYNSNEPDMIIYLDNEETSDMKYEDLLNYDFKDNTKFVVSYPKYDEFRVDMLNKGIILVAKHIRPNIYLVTSTIFSVLVFLCLLQLVINNYNKIGNMNDSELLIKKENITTRFNDVIGHDEAVEELRFLTSFINNSDNIFNARVPKGILMVGPPGTGKTLLARATAGECGTSFIYMNASSFVEQIVGTGAKRVRQLFKLARNNTPCIIFIDEIDAIDNSGKKNLSSSSEDIQTFNALLQEMDGFKKNKNIIVMAATNHPESLSDALKRSGRFDRTITLNPPSDNKTRVELLKYYLKDKNFDNSIDLYKFAKSIQGFTGADIDMIVNTACLLALEKNLSIINIDVLEEAVDKTLLKGNRKKNNIKDNSKQDVVRYHESGHAVMHYLFGIDIARISVQESTSGVGGFVLSENEDNYLMTKTDIINRIKILYGGRASEEIKFGKDFITVGASNDISEATNLLLKYSSILAFDDKLGIIDYTQMNTVKIENDVIKSISQLSKDIYKEVLDLLRYNYILVETLAGNLELKESMTGDEVNDLLCHVDFNHRV